MAVAGVANVAIWGEKDPQLQVVVDPDRLRANSVTLDMVMQTVRDATSVGAGGFIDTANQRLAIRHVPTIYSPEGLGDVVVSFQRGVPLKIRDVADVVVDSPPPIGDAIINGRPGLLLIVEKQPWANTLDVTHGVEAVMRDLEPALGDIHYDSDSVSSSDVYRACPSQPAATQCCWVVDWSSSCCCCFYLTGDRP